MFALADVARVNAFTQPPHCPSCALHRACARARACTSIGGWLSTGEDKGDRGVYCLPARRLVIRQRLHGARSGRGVGELGERGVVMMGNARDNRLPCRRPPRLLS